MKKTSKTLDDEIKENFPPSTVNNSRQIVRNLIKKFEDNKSESLQAKIENMTGFQGDYIAGFDDGEELETNYNQHDEI